MARRLLIPVLAVLVALLGGAALWIGGQAREAHARADDRQAALDAAGTHAMNLLALNHSTIDADIKRILDTSTGAARTEFSANAARLKETTLANKVVQTGVLRASGVETITSGEASVLVVADADIRWEGSKAPPEKRRFRWAMQLTKIGSGWLVSKVVQVL
ncbi:hypothetical protein [Nonomuraea sp. NPDC050310]|uniref:hypothetical protein n=1 Tax=unclassified Nonomuraea TaxID=2593643 RepID=UPI0033EEF60B